MISINFFIFLVSIVILIALANFAINTSNALHCVLSMMYIYMFLLAMLVTIGLQSIALLIVVIYAGAVMVLLMFCFQLLDSDKSKDENNVESNLINMVTAEVAATVFISPLLLYTFVYPVEMATLVSKTMSVSERHREYMLKCLDDFNRKVFDNFKLEEYTLADLGTTMYTTYIVATFLCFIILLISLIIIVTSLRDSDSFFTSPVSVKKKYRSSASFSDAMLIFSTIFDYSSNTPIFFMGFISVTMLIVVFRAIFLMSRSEFSFLKFIIVLEIFLVAIIMFITYYAAAWDNSDGIVLVMFSLSIFAAETAVGLTLYSCKSGMEIRFVRKNK